MLKASRFWKSRSGFQFVSYDGVSQRILIRTMGSYVNDFSVGGKGWNERGEESRRGDMEMRMRCGEERR